MAAGAVLAVLSDDAIADCEIGGWVVNLKEQVLVLGHALLRRDGPCVVLLPSASSRLEVRFAVEC